ncbi:hypothetical protein BMF35_a0472 [Aurantiacibacter gangjinensis]|nr:hypothetical protein BMF35_a0472 [Aurantiacibacter gangjinensis]
MGFVFMILVGAISGWLAAFMSELTSHRVLLRNIALGIAGALLAGGLIGPLVVEGDLLAGNYSVALLVLSCAGALLMLLATKLLQSSDMR